MIKSELRKTRCWIATKNYLSFIIIIILAFNHHLSYKIYWSAFPPWRNYQTFYVSFQLVVVLTHCVSKFISLIVSLIGTKLKQVTNCKNCLQGSMVTRPFLFDQICNMRQSKTLKHRPVIPLNMCNIHYQVKIEVSKSFNLTYLKN